jgi:Transmembrane secretion effector
VKSWKNTVLAQDENYDIQGICRQHERITKADLAIEQHAISFHIGKDPPRISHLISEDTSKQNHKTKKVDFSTKN